MDMIYLLIKLEPYVALSVLGFMLLGFYLEVFRN